MSQSRPIFTALSRPSLMRTRTRCADTPRASAACEVVSISVTTQGTLKGCEHPERRVVNGYERGVGSCIEGDGAATSKVAWVVNLTPDENNVVLVRVPRLRLCGAGNTSGCHGDAHSKRLHFRYRDGWEFLRTEPTRYENALACKGWRRCR